MWRLKPAKNLKKYKECRDSGEGNRNLYNRCACDTRDPRLRGARTQSDGGAAPRRRRAPGPQGPRTPKFRSRGCRSLKITRPGAQSLTAPGPGILGVPGRPVPRATAAQLLGDAAPRDLEAPESGTPGVPGTLEIDSSGNLGPEARTETKTLRLQGAHVLHATVACKAASRQASGLTSG